MCSRRRLDLGVEAVPQRVEQLGLAAARRAVQGERADEDLRVADVGIDRVPADDREPLAAARAFSA